VEACAFPVTVVMGSRNAQIADVVPVTSVWRPCGVGDTSSYTVVRGRVVILTGHDENLLQELSNDEASSLRAARASLAVLLGAPASVANDLEDTAAAIPIKAGRVSNKGAALGRFIASLRRLERNTKTLTEWWTSKRLRCLLLYILRFLLARGVELRPGDSIAHVYLSTVRVFP
jgi:hypothetical protein